MNSCILAITRSEEIREYLLSVKNRFFGPIEFRERIGDFAELMRKRHIALLIVDYETVRYLNDKERAYFYRIECPRIILTRRENEFFSFPIPRFIRLGTLGSLQSDHFVKLVNEYYHPLPPASLFARDAEIQFITRNPKMRDIFRNAQKVAQFDTSVLLLGESGTGKDVLADVIHHSSRRSARPMVKVNCAAIPADLLEAELFGYLKGSFTHAFQDKIGRIQLANGSTLFLDEIGDLDHSLQAKLLRVIETGEVDVIGSVHPVKVDVRFISATNRDIKKAVQEKRFREDLYYRLNVVHFYLLPLRDRPEDIPPLTEYFISVFSRKYDKKIGGLEEQGLKKLFEYHWPGNVRELRHFVERLVIQASGKIIGSDLVAQEMEALNWERTSGEDRSELKSFLECQEKQHILQTLVRMDFKVGNAAEALGISRISLFRKMKKFGINLQQLKKARSVD